MPNSNPSPNDFDLERNHPLSPLPEVVAEYEKYNFPYEETIQDRVYSRWYALVKGRPIRQEITQFYRVSRPGKGEFLLYNLKLTGQDWKGNDKDFSLLKGRYQKPIFRLERNPETNETTAPEITSQQTIYTVPYSRQKLEELLQVAVEPISTIVIGPGGKRLGIQSLEDFKNGSIEDLIESATKGKTLDSVIAERNQFVYEKREQKPKKSD